MYKRQDLIRAVAGQDWFDISPEARRARCEELDVEISPDMKDVDVSQQVYDCLLYTSCGTTTSAPPGRRMAF